MSGIFQCPREDDWQRYLLGQTPLHDSEHLERHLVECSACKRTTSLVQATDSLLEMVRVEINEPGGLDPEVDENLIARICRLRSTSRLTSVSSRHPQAGGNWNEESELSALLAPREEIDEMGRIGPYGILRVLGRGGMGIVFLAREQRPRRVVALKMIRDRARGGQRLERFRSESETLARLRHPNVVRVLAAGEHEGRPYFTTEYAEGGSLAHKLAAAPLPAREAAQLLQTLARTVHAAHEQGVVHRDLKPSNVLLNGDGVPLIADFGLAKEMAGPEGPAEEDQRTQTGAILGTPDYMAPEQAAGHNREIGPAVDVYALGAILYECLTGRPPFKAATMLETLDQVRTQEPVPPGRLRSKLPRDLETICLKCLEKEAAKRYASGADLADDLARFLGGEPIRARRAGMPERLSKWARRNPTGAALLLVSGLFLIALIAGDQVYSARLRDAVKQARASAADAHEQRSRADAGYQAARDALDRMLRHLEQRRLGEVPQLKELQRAQCEDALVFYQGVFAGAGDSDPEVRLDAARAYQRAGGIQTLLGRGTDALQSIGQAIDLLESLPAQQRERPETQDLLAGCYGDRGLLASQTADRERDVGKALAIRRRLAQEEPDNPRRQHAEALCEHQMGHVLINALRWADAEPHVARAAAIRRRLMQDFPREEIYQEALAEDYVNLALVYGNLRREEKGAATHEKLESLLRPLIARRPDDVRIRLTLASAEVNWGIRMLSKGQPTAGVSHCSEAVELAEAALRREPNLFMARATTLNAHGARAQNFEALGRWAEAARDWDRVVELDPSPKRWSRRVLRAQARARAGEYARAVAEAKEVAELREVSAGGLWELVRVHVLSIGAARADTRLSMTERAALAERYAAAAVGLLRRLHEQGFFKDASHSNWLKTDPDWQPLRDREDFRKLLEAIAPAGK